MAVKCDLCNFREQGPACVEACPHKALHLIDDQSHIPETLLEQMKETAAVTGGIK